jgi:hypothetical protein
MFLMFSKITYLHPSYWIAEYCFDTCRKRFLDFFQCTYSILLHLAPLRFHCVGGCWHRTQDRCNYGIGCQTHSAKSHPRSARSHPVKTNVHPNKIKNIIKRKLCSVLPWQPCFRWRSTSGRFWPVPNWTVWAAKKIGSINILDKYIKLTIWRDLKSLKVIWNLLVQVY